MSPSYRSAGRGRQVCTASHSGAKQALSPQHTESLLNYSFWKGLCFITVIFVIHFLIKILHKICKPRRASHRDSKDMGCQELFKGESVPSERHMGMEYSLH